jgi:cell division protein FtsL
VKLYLIAGLAIVAFLGWHSYKMKELKTTKAELARKELALDTANAQIAAEQAARAHEQRIAKEASDGFQTKVVELQNELAARPLKPVVIRVRDDKALSASGSPTGTTPGPDAETSGRVVTEVEIDIAPGLTAYAMDCQLNAAQLSSLQEWVMAR